jgi:hypothetical protein
VYFVTVNSFYNMHVKIKKKPLPGLFLMLVQGEQIKLLIRLVDWKYQFIICMDGGIEP